MRLRVINSKGLIFLNSNGRSLAFSREGAEELLSALILVVREGHSEYINDEERELEEARIADREREQLARAGQSMPRAPTPHGRLEDI